MNEKKTRERKAAVGFKVECERCKKETYLSFLPDGSRKYYCDDCLKQFNLDRKRGRVKKSFNSKRGKNMYEFVCEGCDKQLKVGYQPKILGGELFCLDCYDDLMKQKRKSQRKGNIVIAK